LHIKIDFSHSRLYNVYANGVKIPPNPYNQTTKSYNPIAKTQCGENRYTKLTYVYEFYLTYGCEVKLEGVNFLEGMVRLQWSIDDFFADGGHDTFVDRLSSALGIPQNNIRIVDTREGSVILEWYAHSSKTLDTDQVNELEYWGSLAQALYSQGHLDLGSPILGLTTNVVSSNGTVISNTNGNYEKKDIHVAVYILVGVAGIAVLIGVILSIYKLIKMSKSYKKIQDNLGDYAKGDDKSEIQDGKMEGPYKADTEGMEDIKNKQKDLNA
jgi:hypothetical protein